VLIWKVGQVEILLGKILAMSTLALLILCCLTLSSGLNAQPPQNIAAGLQQILEEALPVGSPSAGGVMGVVVPGEWSWFGAAGSGIAGITSGHPTTTAQTTTRFRVGSITKNMVATCILKLEQDGLLSIEDPIGNYLRPTLLNDTLQSSATVTIRQLLNHTSGIANSAANPSCQMDILSAPLASHTLEEAVWCGASQGELFSPGTDWSYSNTNYSLIAMIIEEVTGMSYQSFLDQTIIQPLSLNNTEIPTTDEVSGDHMGCYWYVNGLGWVDLTIIDASTYTGWADVVSSAADLLIYYEALLEGSIINSAQLEKMKTIVPEANDYGLGMEFNSVDFVSYYGHYGEVANTNGMLFFEINSTIAPNGFYLAYNFNRQGVPMVLDMDRPVYYLLKGNLELENRSKETFRVYPVPSSSKVWVELEVGIIINGLELFDLIGRKVDFTCSETIDGKFELNSSHLSHGTYTLVVQTATASIRKQLVIE
jgi:D-alanyl-D-alanine carboxypeptidase